MCDVDTFDDSRLLLQFQDSLQGSHPFFGIHVEDLGLSMHIDISSIAQVFDQFDLVSQASCFLELEFRGCILHFTLHLDQEFLATTLQECLKTFDIPFVVCF